MTEDVEWLAVQRSSHHWGEKQTGAVMTTMTSGWPQLSSRLTVMGEKGLLTLVMGFCSWLQCASEESSACFKVRSFVSPVFCSSFCRSYSDLPDLSFHICNHLFGHVDFEVRFNFLNYCLSTSWGRHGVQLIHKVINKKDNTLNIWVQQIFSHTNGVTVAAPHQKIWLSNPQLFFSHSVKKLLNRPLKWEQHFWIVSLGNRHNVQ